MNHAEREAVIVGAGVTGPRVTAELIEATILAEQYHVFPGTCLTVCCLTLQNGFTVVGSAACADPANFREEVGRKFSREDARNKIGSYLGYELRSKLHAEAQL